MERGCPSVPDPVCQVAEGHRVLKVLPPELHRHGFRHGSALSIGLE